MINPEEFLQIKLKVKSHAKAGNSNIVIENQTTSEGKEDIEIDNLSIDIKIIQEDNNNPGIGDNGNNNSGNSNQGDNGNNNSGNSNQGNNENNNAGDNNQGNNNDGNTIGGNHNQNNNQGGGKTPIEIPKAGLGNYQTLILLAIEVLIIIAIYSFVKYKKINTKHNIYKRRTNSGFF